VKWGGWNKWRERRDRAEVQRILQTNDQRVLALLDERFHKELEELMTAAPTPVHPKVDMESVRAAMEQVLRAREPKRVLVVHPDMDVSVVEPVARELDIEVVRGNPAMIKPGEAYIMYDPRSVGWA